MSTPLSPTQRNLRQDLRFDALDLVRAVSVLGVFLFHLQDLFAPFGPRVHFTSLSLYTGLNFLFVISGYCIMATIVKMRQNGQGVGLFTWRRLRRIYPPLWIAIFIAAAQPVLSQSLAILRHTQNEFAATLLPYQHYTWLTWLRVATLTQVFCSGGERLHVAFGAINSAYWTLGIEVQFYLTMALAMACGRRAAWMLIALSALGLGCSFFPGLFHTGLVFPFWPQFAVGILVYVLLHRGLTPQRLLGRRLALAGPFPALVPMVIYMRSVHFAIPENARTFVILIALFLWLLYAWEPALKAWKYSSRLRTLPVRLAFAFGARSYSIYLLHLPVSMLLRHILEPWVPQGVCFILLVVALTYVACLPFYAYCERPFMSSRSTPRPEPRRPEDQASPLPAVQSRPADAGS